MKNEIGISICTKGSATRLIGSKVCYIRPNTASIVSYAFPSVDLDASDDFHEVAITEKEELVAEGTAHLFSHTFHKAGDFSPCIRLDEATALSHIENID